MRRKVRTDRRPGMPIENALVFYPRYAWETISIFGRAAVKLCRLWRFARSVQRDPNAKSYTDAALIGSTSDDSLEMFQLSESARKAGERARRIEEHKQSLPAPPQFEAAK